MVARSLKLVKYGKNYKGYWKEGLFVNKGILYMLDFE